MDKVDLEFVAVIIGVILLFFVLGGIATVITLVYKLLCWLGWGHCYTTCPPVCTLASSKIIFYKS
jgi:hypothetical protein